VAASCRLLHRGGDEEAEPLGVEERYPVRLMLVERQSQGCQVRLPETVGLRKIHLQPVPLEEPVLGGEEDQGARPGMHLFFHRLPDKSCQLLRYLHLL
jgi:hypothetical protein